MRWVVAEVVAIAETIRAIVVDRVVDRVTMRHRHHLVQAQQDREIMVVAVLQIQIHTRVVEVEALAARA
jgi:hypothetical protein